VANQFDLVDWRQRFEQWRGQLPLKPWQQISALVAIAFILSLIIWWMALRNSHDYAPLYGNLSPEDSVEAISVLDESNTEYRINEQTGQILVDKDEVYSIRMRMAGSGVPKYGTKGYELLDQRQGFGVSQFMEHALYQRALEGELSRAVISLDSIEHARVQLALPPQKVFVHDKRKPSASVVVVLRPGWTLGREQVAAIRHLVASSVVNLDAASVSVVDDAGHLLSDDEPRDGIELVDQQLEFVQRVESRLVENVMALLTPVVGENSVHARATVEIDFSQNKQEKEQYVPEPRALRSEQYEQEINQEQGPIGVPGALTNQPPAAGTAPQLALPGDQIGGGGNAGAPPSQMREGWTRNWEIDSTLLQTIWPPGGIKRVSVAVVVDDAFRPDEKGRWFYQPRSEEEMQALEALIQGAIGYVSAREDTVTVVNRSFESVTGRMGPPIPWWQEEWFWDIVRQAFLGILLVLLFLMALRMLRSWVGPEGAAMDTAHRWPVEPELEDDEAKALREQLEEDARLAGMTEEERQEYQMKDLQQSAQEIAKGDATKVAQLVRDWISEDVQADNSEDGEYAGKT